MTPEDNIRLTRVGPGTPMGDAVAPLLAAGLPFERASRNATARRCACGCLCEDLIAFRDSEGHVGLVDAYCPHRRAPLFFGRNEECGLRCVYHGWKFDRSGALRGHAVGTGRHDVCRRR